MSTNNKKFHSASQRSVSSTQRMFFIHAQQQLLLVLLCVFLLPSTLAKPPSLLNNQHHAKENDDITFPNDSSQRLNGMAALLLNNISYPDDRDFSYFKPLTQSYWVTNFVLDNTFSDLCDDTDLLEDIKTQAPNKSNNSICVEYFCECSIDTNVCFNLTKSLVENERFRIQYFRMINYCIHCNSNHSQLFINSISEQSPLKSQNSKCLSRFPSYELLQRSLLKHCNIGISQQRISTLLSFNDTKEDFNVGIIDWRFFQIDNYYSNIYLKNHSDNNDNTLHMFNTLFLEEFVNPVMCWCRNEFGKRFAFQCGDAYYNFLIPFKYIGSPLLVLILLAMSLLLAAIYNIIPLYLTKRRAVIFRSKSEIANQMQARFAPFVYLRIALEEFVFTDLRSVILLFEILGTVCLMIENIICFLWNFSFFNDSQSSDLLWGCFRALAMCLYAFSFMALLVHWGHIVDLLKTSTTKKSLSRFNIILILSIYTFNCCIMIIGVIVCIVLKSTAPLFAVAAISMIVAPSILIICFTIYTFLIFKRLKLAHRNIREMRFTKSMTLFNISLISAFILGIIFLPTFVVYWDVYGIYVAIHKNLAIDLACVVITGFFTYILANEGDITKYYPNGFGKFVLCMSSVSEGTSPKIIPNTATMFSPPSTPGPIASDSDLRYPECAERSSPTSTFTTQSNPMSTSTIPTQSSEFDLSKPMNQV
ncbi:hypothetical protein C9374_004615 [Naegleria lovaniensis]|uniref:Uncharacterized protein n=1 Tax=Naegleria lovaniensis TaxID=51637 RepID=A0AA88GSD6_NAELO|nr:uncharacterized protein C9374_004615 [Naegleria lovaniensis]KAG2383278.1 hypothetical protein C9374_004615 [Naegleria lovaniensis]